MNKTLFVLIFIYTVELLGVNAGIVPLKLEGVYAIQSFPMDFEEALDLEMTILQNIRTQSLTMAIAQSGTNVNYFFLRDVQFSEINQNVFHIFKKAAPSIMDQVTVEVDVYVDLDRMSVRGVINANSLKQPEPLEFTGFKLESLYEQWGGESISQNCGSLEEQTGLYRGSFGGKEATLTIRLMGNINGKKILSSNMDIRGTTRVLYQDGYFSESLKMLSLISESMFMMNSQIRKLLLKCDQDDEFYLLEGIHISSSGRLVRDVKFKKRKDNLN